MAIAQVHNCLYTSVRDVCIANPTRISPVVRIPQKGSVKIGTAFATGTPLLIQKASYSTKASSKSTSVSIRCEQSAKDSNSLDVWLGRFAMIGFAAAISVEIATGKGLLENFGLTGPLPTVALAVTGLVGVLTAIFIFQSASKN
ncbi:OLC1v1003297C1 [Oldenlandia corymbosa var. corymbosa]|uniref:OLC1v1003297C1 n=1 Tax=Oldenlandia corymbosa var. corymbosa TaxID=529605 RepID=A0AAV1DCJ1_OLDCO|nr:OLC1v1003297C1 [Oldenlandia corymbosa var. corymbosa]